MRIYNVMKILSSENKSKIIAHFWNCTCRENDCVQDLENKLKINQSNLSKHIGMLTKLGVLEYKKAGKTRIYTISNKFKSEWDEIISPILYARENSKFMCTHCNCKGVN